MKDIDIYDFDKTIVPFDSGSLFVGYCILHYPWCIVIAPVLLVAGLLMVCRIISLLKSAARADWHSIISIISGKSVLCKRCINIPPNCCCINICL